MSDIDWFYTYIKDCARCGANHPQVPVYPLKGKPPADGFNYWAMCPVLREQIFLEAKEAERCTPAPSASKPAAA